MSKNILVSGGFDPIHSGHVRMIQEAATEGNVIVVVNSDDWLIRKKGFYFMTWDERAEIIRSIRGVAEVVKLSQKETERRWAETTPQWPIMHAVLKGVTRDQMMARHKSNHIQVVYAPNEKAAHKGARIKAAMLAEMGLRVQLCGEVQLK